MSHFSSVATEMSRVSDKAMLNERLPRRVYRNHAVANPPVTLGTSETDGLNTIDIESDAALTFGCP